MENLPGDVVARNGQFAATESERLTNDHKITPMMKRNSTKFLTGLALLPATTALAWDWKLWDDKHVEFHGFASQGFLSSTEYNYLGNSKNGSFQFSEMGLNASFSPFNRTRISAQGFMFDLGDVNNNRVFLDYASVEYTFSDLFGVRAGRVRRPGGIYNHIQDVDLARTAVLLPQGVYDPRWRDFSTSIDGGILFGSVSAGDIGSFSYEGYAGYMNLDDKGGVARNVQTGLPAAPLAVYKGIDPALITGAQVWWNTPWEGLRFGASGGQVWDFEWKIQLDPAATGLPVTAIRKTESDIPYVYLSGEYTWKAWTFQTEYYAYMLHLHDSILGNPVGESKYAVDAWYIGASYRFNKWFEAGTYYTEHYADTGDRGGHNQANSADGFQKDLAISTRFDLTDWWLFKLEGHWIRGASLLQDNEHNPDRSDEGSWWMFAAKTTFNF